MSKKRLFDTKFWADTFVVDSLNPLDRYLFMYLMLNERTNLAGVYELPIRTIAYEVGLDDEVVRKMLKRLEPKVYYIEGWVVLTNAVKHQNYNNSKIKEGIRKELCKVPSNLLEFIHFPNDIDIDLSCPIDESFMTHPHYIIFNNIKFNLIEFNGRRDLAEIFSYWQTKVGVAQNHKNEKNLTAAGFLIKKYGLDNLKQIIDLAAAAHLDQYAGKAGKIADFYQLKNKIDDLMVWSRSAANQTVNAIGVVK